VEAKNKTLQTISQICNKKNNSEFEKSSSFEKYPKRSTNPSPFYFSISNLPIA